jgi:hypothetical protein
MWLLTLYSVTNALVRLLVKGELILSKSVYEAHYTVDVKNKIEIWCMNSTHSNLRHASYFVIFITYYSGSRARHIRRTEDLKLTAEVENSYKNVISYQQRSNTFNTHTMKRMIFSCDQIQIWKKAAVICCKLIFTHLSENNKKCPVRNFAK